MRKADLMEHFDDIAADPRVTREGCEAHIASGEVYLDGELIVSASSGTSGVRAIGVAGWEETARGWASLTRFVMRWAARRGALQGPPSTFVIGARPGPHASYALGRIFGSGTESPVSVLDPIEDVVAALNSAAADLVIVYASLVPRLVDEARAGRLRIRPKLLMPVAEPLAEEDGHAAAGLWGCGVISSWAATEVGVLGGGSGFDSGMLVYDDWTIVEPVDVSGRPVAPGQVADKLFVTPLYRRVLPLIRYELTDQLAVLEAPASCGSRFTRTTNVVGRLDDQFVYAGGLVAHPHVFRGPLARQPGLREYQVLQTTGGADVRVVAATGFDADRLRQQIVDGLARLGLDRPSVVVVPVSEIGRQGGGAKLRRFVPLPQPGA